MPINGLDLFVGVVVLLSAVLAYYRGFVHEILSVAAWIGAVLAAIYGMPLLRDQARELIPIDWAADAATAVVIFLVVLVALSIVTKMLAKSIQASALNSLDRSLGFVYGIVRAAVILAICLIILDWLVERDERPEWIQRARTVAGIELCADVMRDLLPQSFMAAEDAVNDAADSAKEVQEMQRTFERLVQPTPESVPEGAEDKDGSYDQRERRTMDRLFETNKDPDQ